LSEALIRQYQTIRSKVQHARSEGEEIRIFLNQVARQDCENSSIWLIVPQTEFIQRSTRDQIALLVKCFFAFRTVVVFGSRQIFLLITLAII